MAWFGALFALCESEPRFLAFVLCVFGGRSCGRGDRVSGCRVIYKQKSYSATARFLRKNSSTNLYHELRFANAVLGYEWCIVRLGT